MIKTKTALCLLYFIGKNLTRCGKACGTFKFFLGAGAGRLQMILSLPALSHRSACERSSQRQVDFLLSCLRLKRSRRWRTSRDTLDARGTGPRWSQHTAEERCWQKWGLFCLELCLGGLSGPKNLHGIYFKTQVLP